MKMGRWDAARDQLSEAMRVSLVFALLWSLSLQIPLSRPRSFDTHLPVLSFPLQPGRAAQSTKLLLQRARCQMNMGNLEEAVSDCATVLKMDSSSLDAYEVRRDQRACPVSLSFMRRAVRDVMAAAWRGVLSHGRLPDGSDSLQGGTEVSARVCAPI
jgi:hypothetical protein